MTTTSEHAKGLTHLAIVTGAIFTLLLAGVSNGLLLTSASADSEKQDDTEDSPLKDFDIRTYGVAGNDIYIQVYGLAGQTLPEGEHTAYAYVVFTDKGIFASDSHEAQHADSENVANRSWHGHKLNISETGCINEIGGFKASAKIAGTHVFIEGTEATQVFGAKTVQLEILVEDPDNVPPGTCIAQIVDEFDSASGL